SALSASTTSLTITDFNESTPGAPDGSLAHLAVTWAKVIHSGVWANQVQALTATTITLGGNGMTTNQWAGRVVSLLGKLDSTQELIVLNMPVSASSASSGGFYTLTIGPNSR